MTTNYYKYSATMGDRTYFTSVVHHDHLGDKRYFSNIESEIYFGDHEMTDLYQFEFGIDEKILPVYGYNCYYASELVSGQRIVQGQFVVNYTDSMLIQSVLSSIEDSVYREITSPDYFPGGDLHHAIYDKQFDIMIGYGYYNNNTDHRYEAGGQTFRATCQTIIGAKITGMHKVMDTTGQPILEVFTFVAKDFLEENIEPINADTSSSETNKKEEIKNTGEQYKCTDMSAKDRDETLKKNDEYVKLYPSCNHFIYTLTYERIGRIRLHVKEGSRKPMILKSFYIDNIVDTGEKDEYDYPIPRLPASMDDNLKTKHSIECRIPQDSIYKIERRMRKGVEFFTCDLVFVVVMGDKTVTVSDEAILKIVK